MVIRFIYADLENSDGLELYATYELNAICEQRGYRTSMVQNFMPLVNSNGIKINVNL